MTSQISSNFIGIGPVSKTAMRSVLNTARDEISDLQRAGPFMCGATIGSDDALIAEFASPNTVIPSYTDGLTVYARMHVAAAAGATLRFNALDVKPIKLMGTDGSLADVAATDLMIGQYVQFTYAAGQDCWVAWLDPMSPELRLALRDAASMRTYLDVAPRPRIRYLTSNTTLTAADADAFILVDASGGAFTVTLPLTDVLGAGKPFKATIARADAGSDNVTLACSGSDLFYTGLSSIVMLPGDRWNLTSNTFGLWYDTLDGTTIGRALLHASTAGGARAVIGAGEATPAGVIMAFSMFTAPSGWLSATGAAISRSTYATLFSVIGTTWGVGDGSTTFNIPDLRGVFLRGWDNGRGLDAGRTFATYQDDALQNHRHAFNFVRGNNSGGNPGVLGTENGWTYTTGPEDNGSTIRLAAETRPKNNAVLFCVKY